MTLRRVHWAKTAAGVVLWRTGQGGSPVRVTVGELEVTVKPRRQRVTVAGRTSDVTGLTARGAMWITVRPVCGTLWATTRRFTLRRVVPGGWTDGEFRVTVEEMVREGRKRLRTRRRRT